MGGGSTPLSKPDLFEPGAFDAAALQGWNPFARSGGRKYLRPTIVHCNSMDHTLANREFLCPYASVVEVPQAEMLRAIGPTLVVTAITKDETFKRQLPGASNVERLNIGPISTMKISWDQPHEGNMFEFLFTSAGPSVWPPTKILILINERFFRNRDCKRSIFAEGDRGAHEVIFGSKCVEQLVTRVPSLGKRALLVTDLGLTAARAPPTRHEV